MSRAWLDKLERRLGFLTFPGLASFLVAMNAAVAGLSLIKPEFPLQLALDPEAILRGQVWRLLSFVLIPPALEPLWMVFWLIMLFTCLRALEDAWGDFSFNAYYAIGMAATGLCSLALGMSASNFTLNTSLFLAFANLFPNLEVLIMFVVPVKVKWLGRLTWALLGWNGLAGGMAERLFILAGLANYFIFFGADHWRDLRVLWHHHRRG